MYLIIYESRNLRMGLADMRKQQEQHIYESRNLRMGLAIVCKVQHIGESTKVEI